MKTKPKQKTNILKIIAIVVIVLFCAILLGGLIRMYHFRSSFIDMNDQQKEAVKEIASNDMLSRGKNVSDYRIDLADKIRTDSKESMVPISFSNDKETISYLIDLNSNKIVMRSDTEFYEPLPSHGKEDGWTHWGLFIRK
jgi:uncharacterized protein YpmB